MVFPEDKRCLELDDQYMFGSDCLVAPVTEYGARERKVYLPEGIWRAENNGDLTESSGEYVMVSAPLNYMPVFWKEK